VAAPKDNVAAPTVETPTDGTSASLSAGGQYVTGNSRLLALTLNGMFEKRWGANGVGASVLGNYGQGAPPGNAIVETTENIQGRLRYDRYLIEQTSLFLINTARQDRFEGLDLRYNLDPGVKYMFFSAATNALWVEAGYDFQYDVRRDDARIPLDATGKPDNAAPLLAKTEVNHSLRLYAGYKHAFNDAVTLSTGLEFIQSFTDKNHRWVNYDLLFAAKVFGGLAVGLGVSARYDSEPLPGKQSWDTASTMSLIYSYSDAAPKSEPPPACPPSAPAPAPASAPAPATTPASAPAPETKPAPAPTPDAPATIPLNP
jgi:hypothetical protein